MTLRVQDTKTLPNGGFIFYQDQPRFKPPSMLSWNGTKLAIIAFRKDNGLDRSQPVEVEADMHAYICDKHPEWCYNTEQPLANDANRVVSQCRGCGGKPA